MEVTLITLVRVASAQSWRSDTNSAWRRRPPAGLFGEFGFGFDFAAEPGVVGHLVGGHAFAPVATARQSTTTWRTAILGSRAGLGVLHGEVGGESLPRCAKKLF